MKIQKNEREVSFQVNVNLPSFDDEINIQITPVFSTGHSFYNIPNDENCVYEHGHIEWNQDVDDEDLIIENTIDALKSYRRQCEANAKTFANYIKAIDLFIEENKGE